MAHGIHCHASLDPCAEVLAAENNRGVDISDIRVCRVSSLLYNFQTDSDVPYAHHSHDRDIHPLQASRESLDHIYTAMIDISRIYLPVLSVPHVLVVIFVIMSVVVAMAMATIVIS